MATEPIVDPFDSLEGNMAHAAYQIMYEDMTKPHGGIKVLKHPRSGKKAPRETRIKFKKMEGTYLWLGEELEEEEVRVGALFF